jgi:single-stranded-DNA-specific exonuclease
MASAGLAGHAIDSYDVGFKLAPRLNACGRMGHARLAVELLTRADDARATEIATYLEQQNRERQKLEKEILVAALEQVQQKGFDADTCAGIVLGGQGWHAGVIGIVASRIVDRFHRPTIMVSLHGDQGQGSGRSIAGFHLTKALEACGGLLESFGGHEMAAGLKLRAANLDAFAQAFAQYAHQTLEPAMLQPELSLEASAQLQEFSSALVTDLSRLGPFGHANRRPIFCCPGLQVKTTPRRVGQNAQHLQLTVAQNGAMMRCIGFNLGDQAPRLTVGTAIDLAVEPIINQFNGRTSVELEIRDLRLL